MNARRLFGMIMTLYHEEFGSGEPLIICHGFLGSSSNWRAIAQKLAAQFHVYVLDLRNHGMSFHDSDCTYASMANDVLDFIRIHHLESPILMGHSMGGKVVMQAASDALFDIQKIIVVDIAPREYDSRHLSILRAMHAVSLGDLSSVLALDSALKRDIPDPFIRGFLLKNVVRQADGLRWKINLEAFLDHYSDIAASPILRLDISIPTLFIRGALSDYIEASDEAIILTHFDGCRFVTIPGVGHYVHVEAQELFLSAVLDFLCYNRA